MSQIHRLKTWPGPFRLVQGRQKDFEIRKNDRGFQKGDALVLDEWNPDTGKYTSAPPLVRIITCMIEGFGLEVGHVALGLDAFGEDAMADLIVEFAPPRPVLLPSEGGSKP